MRVLVKTYGCPANSADSQAIVGCLLRAGYDLARSEQDADVVVFNTCAVKGPTEDRVISDLRRVLPGKKVVVAGCLPLVSFDRLKNMVRFDGVIGPVSGSVVVDVVKRVVDGEKVELLTTSEAAPKLELPRVRSSSVVSIVPVASGCLGSCAYCCVVFARGRLRSCAVAGVADLVRRDLACGAREFWVTAQDMGCYGNDLGTSLAELLHALSGVEGDFKVRVGMMTPNTVKNDLRNVIDAFGNKKIFKFAHLPVQSGNDKVLRLMRRFYSVGDFEEIVRSFRRAFPEITIATDVICGFPGETLEDFDDTLRLIERVRSDVVNISKFFARPGTAASKMRDDFVGFREIKRRATIAAQLVKKISLENNERWVGWEGEILIDEKGKVPGSWVGRNFAYRPVAVKSKEKLLGETVKVKVVEAFPTYLAGEIFCFE